MTLFFLFRLLYPFFRHRPNPLLLISKDALHSSESPVEIHTLHRSINCFHRRQNRSFLCHNWLSVHLLLLHFLLPHLLPLHGCVYLLGRWLLVWAFDQGTCLFLWFCLGGKLAWVALVLDTFVSRDMVLLLVRIWGVRRIACAFFGRE